MEENGNLEGEPSFMKSVNELWKLSAAMHAFKSRWDELEKHIDFIQNAIEREERLAMTSMRSQAQQQEPNAKSTLGTASFGTGVGKVCDCDEPLDADIEEVPDTNKQQPNTGAADASDLNKPSNTSFMTAPVHITPFSINPIKISVSDKPSNIEDVKESDSNEVTNTKAMNATDSRRSEQQEAVAEVDEKPMDDKTCTRPLHSEIENICRLMNGGNLRRYIRIHITDYTKLRKEVPAALKLAADPARLVLDCVGKFYIQGQKAFVKGSPANSARQASVFVMEFFLLMGGCDEMKPSVKEEAEAAALAWRKRIIGEGGLPEATRMDARGLLLFVSCFGIPSIFTREDLVTLLLLSGPRVIGEALRKSTSLVPRIPDIVEHMKSNRLEVEAVDLVYMFRLEYKCSPTRILMSFQQKLKEDCDEMKKGSPTLKNKAKQKLLDGLRSVAKCLEFHKVDPGKLLPGWQLEDTIAKLEKEVSDLEKRKHEDDDSSTRSENQAKKRSRVTGETSSTPRLNGLKEQYPPPVHHSGTGFSPRSNLYPTASTWHPDHAHAYYPELLVGIGMREDLILDRVPPSTLAFHRERLYGDHDLPFTHDGFLRDRLMIPSQSLYPSRSFLEQSSSFVDRFPGLSDRQSMGSSDLYQFADSVTERDHPGGGLRGSPGSRFNGPSSYRSYLY